MLKKNATSGILPLLSYEKQVRKFSSNRGKLVKTVDNFLIVYGAIYSLKSRQERDGRRIVKYYLVSCMKRLANRSNVSSSDGYNRDSKECGKGP